MHVGKYQQSYKCSDIFLDSWEVKEAEHLQTGKVFLKETFLGQQKINQVNNEKYLGDQISADGTNKRNSRTEMQQS